MLQHSRRGPARTKEQQQSGPTSSAAQRSPHGGQPGKVAPRSQWEPAQQAEPRPKAPPGNNQSASASAKPKPQQPPQPVRSRPQTQTHAARDAAPKDRTRGGTTGFRYDRK
eukprot:3114230-Alexandrium_andersonii.AAC.1